MEWWWGDVESSVGGQFLKEAYTSNLSVLMGLEPSEKFVVVGGGGGG